MLQDFRFALRLFRKHPAPVGIAIGGLALAIGVVSSVFTIVDATMLKPYGMDDPSSVVNVGSTLQRGRAHWPYAVFLQLREGATLAHVEASLAHSVRLSTAATGDGSANRPLLFVTGDYLKMLGGRPSIGRALEASDDLASAPPVVMISDRLWRSEFQSDPSVVGRTLWLNGTPVTVVGVSRPDFTAPIKRRPSVWAPMAVFDDVNGGPALDAVSFVGIDAVARLARGATRGAAEDELDALAKRARPQDETLIQRYGAGRAVVLFSAASPIAGVRDADALEAYTVLAWLVGILGLVLAVACANTATLLLAAASTRAHEMGVRLSLGASVGRLMRQVLTESVFLGLAAGGLAFLIATWLVPMFCAFLELELTPEFTAAPDARALLFTIGASVLCGLGAGFSPARHGARGNVLSAIKAQGGPGTVTSSRSRLRTSFIGFQAAVSMLLLVLAALLARTTYRMMRVDIGFDAEHLIAIRFEPPASGFDQPAYFRTVLGALRAVPGVERASVAHDSPFGSGEDLPSQGRSYELSTNRSDADYFATVGLRLVRGRLFTSGDVAADAPVAVISESVARTFYADADPIGKSLSNVPSRRGRQDAVTVVGVVGDALTTYLSSQEHGAIYRPISQQQFGPPNWFTDQGAPVPPQLIVRSPNPGRTARDVEEALRRIDPRVRIFSTFVKDSIDQFVGTKRMIASVFAPAAILVVLLAALGVLGVTAFVVSQRMPEVSLRLAIGASAADVQRLLIKDSLVPVAVGLGAGLVLALLVGTTMSRMLAGISPYDPVSIGAAASILVTGALVAVILPARRAAKADPASLLRSV